MAFEVSAAKTALTGMMHGGNLDEVRNVENVFERASRNMMARYKPIGNRKIDTLTLYNGVIDYSAPSDFRELIDLRPQVNRGVVDNFTRLFTEEFDRRKKNNTLSIRYNSGVVSIREIKSFTPGNSTIHQMDSITANGTWAVGGDAENLTADGNNKVAGSASLNFDLDGSGTSGFIENSSMRQVDWTIYDEQVPVFASTFIPLVAAITSYTLRWGNDSSNYWSRTVTVPHDYASLQLGWNLLRFDWNGATETGTVNPAQIDYIRFTVTYDGNAETDIRVDKIFVALGVVFELEYYSKFLFRTPGGVWQGTIENDETTIELDDSEYNIFLYESLMEAAQQSEGEDATFDMRYAKLQLFGDPSNKDDVGLYKLAKQEHPSESMRGRSTYYKIR